METTTALTVGAVARLAGVTVRTLHHYDEIGLLVPEDRSEAGYRRYTARDVERLQRILAYRALGLPLESIAEVLDAPGASAEAHLRRQRELVQGQLERLGALLDAIDHELEVRRMGMGLTPEERLEVFGDLERSGDLEAWGREAEERWGGTDAYRESARRTASYTKEDWVRIREEGADLERRLAAALRAGTPPDAPEAMDLAEEHRLSIDRAFYACPVEMHVGLTQTYVDDPRFTAHYEEVQPGLATYIRDAAAANAARRGREG